MLDLGEEQSGHLVPAQDKHRPAGILGRLAVMLTRDRGHPSDPDILRQSADVQADRLARRSCASSEHTFAPDLLTYGWAPLELRAACQLVGRSGQPQGYLSMDRLDPLMLDLDATP